MRAPFIVIGLLMAFGATAGTPEDTVRQAMSALAPNVKIDAVQESPIPGFYEAIAGGQFVYVTKDGKYVLDGNAYDVANRRDLTETSRAKARISARASRPTSCASPRVPRCSPACCRSRTA